MYSILHKIVYIAHVPCVFSGTLVQTISYRILLWFINFRRVQFSHTLPVKYSVTILALWQLTFQGLWRAYKRYVEFYDKSKLFYLKVPIDSNLLLSEEVKNRIATRFVPKIDL